MCRCLTFSLFFSFFIRSHLLHMVMDHSSPWVFWIAITNQVHWWFTWLYRMKLLNARWHAHKKLINKQGLVHKEWNKQRMKSHLQISHHGNPKSKYFRQYKEFRIRKWWIAVSFWTTAHLPLPKPNVNPNLLSADCCGVRGGVGA